VDSRSSAWQAAERRKSAISSANAKREQMADALKPLVDTVSKLQQWLASAQRSPLALVWFS
jgi:hypothetical protein